MTTWLALQMSVIVHWFSKRLVRCFACRFLALFLFLFKTYQPVLFLPGGGMMMTMMVMIMLVWLWRLKSISKLYSKPYRTEQNEKHYLFRRQKSTMRSSFIFCFSIFLLLFILHHIYLPPLPHFLPAKVAVVKSLCWCCSILCDVR